MAFTTEQLQEIYAYVMAQMQTSQINELPAWSDYGELLLTDRLAGYKMNEGVTVWIPISAVLELGAGAAGNALAAPSLTLAVASDSQINATWTAVAGATAYKLYRSATPDFVDAVELLNGDGLSFNDSGRTPTSTYYYWLQATGSGFADSPYATANATTTGAEVDTVPPVLISLNIAADNATQLKLVYNEALFSITNGDTSKYSVAGHTISNVVVSGTDVLVTVTTPFVGGEGVFLSYTGSYVRDVAGNLAPTFTNQAVTNNVVIVTVQLSTPAFSVVAAGTDSIDVIWKDIPDGPNLGHYEIERSTDGTTWSSFKITTDGYAGSQVDSGLTPNTTYTYRLRSVSNGGNFTTSNWATASATTNLQAGYNTTFSFETSTSQQGAGVNASVLSTNNNIRLRFTAQSGGVGVNTMHILVSFQEQMRVDFPGAYIGQPFEFVDRAGVVHTDHFVNGNVRF